MAAFATIEQFSSRFERTLTTAELSRAGVLLDDASAVIRVQVPNMADPPPETVVGVVCAMVARAIRNPEGKRSETIDDYSYTRDNAVSVGEVYLTDDERDMLKPPRRCAFTIVPYYPPCPEDAA